MFPLFPYDGYIHRLVGLTPSDIVIGLALSVKSGKLMSDDYILLGDRAQTAAALSNAYLNRLIGVDVRVLQIDDYNKLSPFKDCMFSTHDSDFVGVHRVLDERPVTHIIGSSNQVRECCQFYDEIFQDDRYKPSLEVEIVGLDNSLRIVDEAIMQFTWFRKQAAERNVLAVIEGNREARDEKRSGLTTSAPR